MTTLPTQELDAQVRRVIYSAFIDDCTALSQEAVASLLGESIPAVKAAYARLAEAHLLVLQPGSGEVLMANPFSAVPTAFRVIAGERAWWGNCIWDSMGVCAMTAPDATIFTSCPDCGEAMTLVIANYQLQPAEGSIHFAVPAAHWWDDIVFT